MVGSDDLIGRIRSRLLDRPDGAVAGTGLQPDWRPDVPYDRPPTPAAVLIGLVHRPAGFSVLYTERSPGLRAHSGQIAFPGGKIDPTDASAADAALREAGEEVALERADASVIGYLPTYLAGSNYIITPVVAVVEPSHSFVPNPDEVRAVFEVPLEWLMDVHNFGTHRISRGGREYTSPQLVHGEFVIWGITANLTRRFHDLALAPEGVR